MRNAHSRKGASLKRLPRDFSWKLLDSLFGCLCHELPAGLLGEWNEAFRLRSASKYLAMQARWGLQSIDPNEVQRTPYKMAIVNLLVNFAKKDPSFETVSPRERKTQCLARVLERERGLYGLKIPIDSILSLAKGHASRILGACPDVDTIATGVKHGPGTTTHRTWGHNNRYFKYLQWPYYVAPSARDLLRVVIQLDDRWMGALEDSYRTRFGIPFWSILNWTRFWDEVLKPWPANKITTVPKDGARDRPIAIEPVGNIFLQLGIERVIRTALLREGLDLNDQGPNQGLALLGSLEDSALSPITIDLSDASDTVSSALVEALLPSDWYTLLKSVRSPWGELPDGSCILYSKMSSMGNGYTFVLESLVFYCLAKAISDRFGHPSDRKSIRVYGDDIVIPKYLWFPLRDYLGHWGFSVNIKKSFTSGFIRESCGADFFQGINIRPVFLRGAPVDIPALLDIRNRLHRWFVCKLGCSIPQQLDEFFLSFVDRPDSLPVGPECDDETDTFWHSCDSHKMPEFVRVKAYRRRVQILPAREFWFRRLMHDLRGVESSGGRFQVNSPEMGTIRQTWRDVYRSFYRDDFGLTQDHTRPRYQADCLTIEQVAP